MVDLEPTTSRTKLGLLGIFLASFGYRALYFSSPSLRDEGIFAFIAQEILRGYLPFTTVMDQKGVLVYLEMALALAVFGEESIAGIRALAALFVCLSALALYELGRQTFGSRVGLGAAFLLVFHFSLRSQDAHQCGTEIFATLPSILSVLCVWYGYRKQNLLPYLWSGVFLGFSIWSRATYLFMAVLFVGFLALYETKGRKLKTIALGVGGALLGSAPFLLWYLANGELETLWRVNYSFNLAWGTGGPLLVPDGGSRVFTVLWQFFRHGAILLVAPVLGALLWKKNRETDVALVFVMMWSAVCFFMYWSAGIYHQKQVLQFVPCLALLAALSFEWAFRSDSRALKAFLSLALLGSLSLGVSGEFYGPEISPPGKPKDLFYKSEKLGHWLRANTDEDEEFYLWGLEWQVYFHSLRRASSSQINLQYILAVAVAAEAGSTYLKEQQLRIERETLEQFDSSNPPKFLVFSAKLDNYDLSGFTLPDKLQTILDRDYVYLFSDDPFYVFLRKGEELPKLPQVPLTR